MSPPKKRGLVFLILTAIFVSSHAKSLPLQQNQGHVEYAILFDAGSSGTRMKIYNFLTSGPSLRPPDVIQLEASLHNVKPGLSSLAGNASQVEAYLMPLIDSAKKTVPQDKQAATPIILLATAGMRLLSDEESNAIMNNVRSLFNDKEKCPFLFKDNNARVITGQKEGLYAFVTVNFLKETLQLKHDLFGSLDLGGASQQNTWVTKFKSGDPDVFVVKLGEETVVIFSRSYLGYGRDQALQRYLRYITVRADCHGSSSCVVQSPCHNKGFEEAILPDRDNIIFKGTAHVNKCKELIKRIFFCKSSDLDECPFSDQPRLKGDFYAMSAYYYAVKDIDTDCSDCKEVNITPKQIASYSKSYCKADYDDINVNVYAKGNCFVGNFIYQLLTKGFGLRRNKMIIVANEIRGFDLSWTLGAVLINTGILNA